MTGCPSCAETWSITTRAITSVALPGVNGTIRRIGFVGQAGVEDGAGPCAHAEVQVQAKLVNAMASHQRGVLVLIICGSRIYGF